MAGYVQIEYIYMLSIPGFHVAMGYSGHDGACDWDRKALPRSVQSARTASPTGVDEVDSRAEHVDSSHEQVCVDIGGSRHKWGAETG